MNETRRTFFGMVAGLLPLGLFVEKKNIGEIKDARIYQRSLEQSEIVAESLAKDRDYLTERCLAAEKDLEQREDVINYAAEQFKPNQIPAIGYECESENLVYFIINNGQRLHTHPDCMKETP